MQMSLPESDPLCHPCEWGFASAIHAALNGGDSYPGNEAVTMPLAAQTSCLTQIGQVLGLVAEHVLIWSDGIHALKSLKPTIVGLEASRIGQSGLYLIIDLAAVTAV